MQSFSGEGTKGRFGRVCVASWLSVVLLLAGFIQSGFAHSLLSERDTIFTVSRGAIADAPAGDETIVWVCTGNGFQKLVFSPDGAKKEALPASQGQSGPSHGFCVFCCCHHVLATTLTIPAVVHSENLSFTHIEIPQESTLAGGIHLKSPPSRGPPAFI